MANRGTVLRSAGTTVVVADCAVGAAAAVDGITSIRFSLSVNAVVVPDTLRAQPSGTFTVKVVPRNVTNAWLSGISPGGFDSVATGLGGWVVACPDDGAEVAFDDGAIDDGVSGVPAGLAAEPDEPPPLQADIRTMVVRERVSRGQFFIDRPRESGHRLPSTLETRG
jgi:hypothetical protein